MTRMTRPSRWLHRLGATMLTASALLVSNVLPTWARTQVRHPQQDYAGSQIIAHEGAVAPYVLPNVPVPGMDVSSHQGQVNWPTATANGARFVYVKATEGTDYANPHFAQQYKQAAAAGLIRGAYHFATPDTSDGTTQADYFVTHGGRWVPGGKTLPPAVDVEYNPYGDPCYGLSPNAMVAWIQAFSNRVKARTGRYPMIYTSTSWWRRCTGDYAGFGASNALWLARYGPAVGPLPGGWQSQTIWQYADSGALPGDQDSFNGSVSGLRALAVG